MIRLLLNTLLRWFVKPIWRSRPTIAALRRRAAFVDRWLGRAGARRPAVDRRLSAEVGALWIGARERVERGAILYLHGGAFCVHLPSIYRDFCFDLAQRTGVPVLLADYRLAPEHPAPAALDDCELAYRTLLREVEAERIVVVGDSAGGNLALALMQRCKRVGLPLPAGAVLLSPVTELVDEGWSTRFNEGRDVMFTHHAMELVVDHYLPGMLAEDPEISPLFGDWHGLPPLRFHVSSSEMLLDHSLRAVERARLCGVDARAEVWLDLPHVFALFGMLAAAQRCRAAIADFIVDRLAAAEPQIDGKRIAGGAGRCQSLSLIPSHAGGVASAAPAAQPTTENSP